jgi:TM2 domain-containing membrane protein YozV
VTQTIIIIIIIIIITIIGAHVQQAEKLAKKYTMRNFKPDHRE